MRYLLAIAACIAADQAVKLYVVSHLALYESAPLLPGVVELLYIQNTGGGFSILAGHTWLLTILTAALMAGVAALMVKRVFPHPLAMWSMAAILGGGLGNLIDRVRLGYVQLPVHGLPGVQRGGYPGGLRDGLLRRLLPVSLRQALEKGRRGGGPWSGRR